MIHVLIFPVLCQILFLTHQHMGIEMIKSRLVFMKALIKMVFKRHVPAFSCGECITCSNVTSGLQTPLNTCNMFCYKAPGSASPRR